MLLVGRILEMRGRDTVRISKVKGHADSRLWFGMVGFVSWICQGINAADEAADFDRRRLDFSVVDARRKSGWSLWSVVSGHPGYCIAFLIAISRAVVDHADGAGTALDPLIWSAGALPRRRRLVHAVRDHAFFAWTSGHLGWCSGSLLLLHPSLLMMLGPGHTLSGSWLSGLISWARCTGQRLELILGLVACLLRCSFCMSCGLVRGWSWKMPFSGIGGLGAQFQCRLFRLVQPLIFGVSCRFIGALFRALCALPGGTGRFMPCDIGADHCKLRHIGLGEVSRPRESAYGGRFFKNELLLLFRDTLLGPLLLFWRVHCLCGIALVGKLVGFPLGAFLLMVTLLTWLLKGLRKLLLCGWSIVLLLLCLVSKVDDGGDWISGPGGGVKRVRLNRKTPAHFVRHGLLRGFSPGHVFGRD